MKSISQPGSNDVKRIRYKQAHEAARKDVERAFGVLKKKWAIVRTPARSRSLKRITHLMYTCIILHNMIRKEKGKAISPDIYPEEQHREDDPVMDAPTIPVSADSSEGNFGDAIDIGVDDVHPVPIAVVSFPAVTIVTTLARHREDIRGIHEYLQGVPIEEEMSTLRFMMGMAKAENASLRGKIKTMEAIETVTHSQERRACMEMERQLALVQESQRQDQENLRKLQELVTSQLGRQS
ncbi:uncharacterized mitochondrial protein-like protein [Tanacetum coccineum]